MMYNGQRLQQYRAWRFLNSRTHLAWMRFWLFTALSMIWAIARAVLSCMDPSPKQALLTAREKSRGAA